MNDADFKPIGPVRPASLYIGWRLYKALGMLAKASGGSREDVAEMVLIGWLNHNHPKVLEWLDGQDKSEQEFIKTLST